MAKRLGRTIVSEGAARFFSFKAHNVGADAAPMAGNCQAPVTISMTGLRDSKLAVLRDLDHAEGYGLIYDEQGVKSVPRNIDLDVRCRKCEACRRAKAHHWKMRALSECGNSARSWFGTLTLAPNHQFDLIARARSRLRAREVHWDELDEERQFKERCREFTREFQLYMKRLRKGIPGLRHLVVFEAHKSGDPHAHVLIHETMAPIRHAKLVSKWTLGFSKWNVIADGENLKRASYVAKYLSKDISAKPCASKNYGKSCK